ncbi:hypothetical protein MG290_09835 [Flavobacterium sp. CBA20B-1]|uniref:hypothetical protein n=1 Tax=unclassified Flavobacterium TaxID=196869 RepID=UPI002225AFE8|nr:MULTISPECIES: hypothetical protein [unclassified Flavobacterium]WCM41257.1 hypothetical protein MG290_09835 [Flavobacterium sp. CBA20B-1]
MKNLFSKIANTAKDSKKEYGTEKKESKTDTKRCETCGAARPKDTNLVICDYCGTPFMNIDVNIKADE